MYWSEGPLGFRFLALAKRRIAMPSNTRVGPEGSASYGQFCPVAMAAEIVCTRWTVLLLREFMAGSTRFNELRRGVPRMSPALLSKRLKELQQAGIIEHRRGGPGEEAAYHLTPAGRDLRDVVWAMGHWGQRW